jgi:hypothetical protein
MSSAVEKPPPFVFAFALAFAFVLAARYSEASASRLKTRREAAFRSAEGRSEAAGGTTKFTFSKPKTPKLRQKRLSRPNPT